MNVTKQQVFDAAWNGLKAQGFVRAVGLNGLCTLEAEDGKRCARGHAFAQYNIDVVDALYDWAARFGPNFETDLMRCHDSGTTPADMERRLREFAKAEGLTIPGDEPLFTQPELDRMTANILDAEWAAAQVMNLFAPKVEA